MAHHRISIKLPTETLQEIDKFAPNGDSPEETLRERSEFIHDAIQAYITQIQTEKLRQQLKEGALRRAERDRHLSDDWFSLEEEACRQNTN
jgi:CopG family transcriptional regulator / antitoxin EndoAI